MRAVFDYFRVILIADDQAADVLDTRYLDRGIILNFAPNRLQQTLIESFIADSKIRTLFSAEEAAEGSLYDKITKQLHHYVATYWFDSPEAVMNIEGRAEPLSLMTIRGVTRAGLQALVDNILYVNRPAKDTQDLVKVMAECGLSYRLNEVKNNELRIQLFDDASDAFDSGDDAVRYIVLKCTKQPLLIKSTEVVSKVQEESNAISAAFLNRHLVPLSHCFNRHKRIIVALKVGSASAAVHAAVNHVTRLSKKLHQPIGMPKNKTFINDALRGFGLYDQRELDQFQLRDLFRYLNLLSFKKLGLGDDVFIIRNGKTWAEADRPTHNVALLDEIENLVLSTIRARVAHALEGKTIALPRNIDYGLPTTRKQTVGQLPFGTKITVEGAISSGIYWKNEWGASDLDLSAVDGNGSRVGWGQLSGYDAHNSIAFSGDIVGAPNGAMEFLTSSDPSYGLFVNIYSGNVGCEGELLVGLRSSEKWIEKAEVREKFKLGSRSNLIGFVDGRTFTVFLGRLGQRRASFDVNTLVIKKGKSYAWTVKKLMGYCGLPWREAAIDADHDLSYSGFTFDKLEALFSI